MRNKIVILVLVAAAVAAFYLLGLGQYMTLENLKANRDALDAAYGNHRAAFIMGFILIYTAQTALSLPGAAILTLAGGAVFGSVMGTVWVNIGATTGAFLAFLLARFLLRDWVVRQFGERMKGFDKGLRENGLAYLLFLRFIPLFPFFMVNLACGITGLSARTYLLGTMVGILPGSFVYANAGASLSSIENLGGITSPRVLVSFALLGLFALVPAVYRAMEKKRTDR